MYACMCICIQLYMYFIIVNLLFLLIYYYYYYYFILNNFSLLTTRWLELGPSDYEKCAFTTWAMENMLKIREWYCQTICIFTEGTFFYCMGRLVMGCLVMGCLVMGCLVMGRLVMGCFVYESCRESWRNVNGMKEVWCTVERVGEM